MKKYLILLMLVSLVAFGQLNLQSFRRQATYVIYDDLDNALMPEALFGIDGWRIYTNLSNLSTGTEQLMNNTTDNTYVFGIVTPEIAPGMKMVFVSGNTKNESDLFNSNETNDFQDIDHDGTFDFRNRVYELNDANTVTKENRTIFMLSKDLGGGIVSFEYQRTSLLDYSESKDSTKVEYYNLPAGDQSMDSVYWETETDDWGEPSNNFGLTYTMKDLNGYNVGIGGGIGFEKYINSEVGDGYHFYDAQYGNPTLYDNRIDTFQYRDEYNLPVFNMNLGVHAYKEDNGNVTEYTGGFGFGIGSADYDSLDRDWYRTQQTNGSGNVEIYSLDSYESDTGAISYKTYYIYAGGRWVRKLNENLYFGMGLDVNYSSSSYGYSGVWVSRDYETFDDGDNEVNDYDDYTSQTTSWLEYTREDVYRNFVITAPVGVELAITKNKNWFIRFGAEAMKSFHTSVSKFNPTDYQYSITVEQHNDGTVDTTIVDDYTINGYRDTDYSENTTTNFAYGLGWHPNDNISIDFIYMFDPAGVTIFDLASIRALRLSATIKIK